MQLSSQESIVLVLLFNIFINDIFEIIRYPHLLFSHDLKLYPKVTLIDDCLVLQSQLDSFQSWCVYNKLDLNISIYKILSFTHKRVPIHFDYKIYDTCLDRCDKISA